MAAAFAAPSVTITPAAARFARRMIRFSGLPAGAGMVLRVAPGGCSGYSTTFDVAAAPAPAEAVVESAAADGPLRLFVDAASAEILEGATLDFVENATEAGLKVTTPAGSGCGCSTSAGPSGVTAVPISAISRRPRA